MKIWLKRISIALVIALVALFASYLIAEVGMKSHYNFGIMIWIFIVLCIGILFWGSLAIEKHEKVKLNLSRLESLPKESRGLYDDFKFYFIFAALFLLITYFIFNSIFNLQSIDNIQAIIKNRP